MPDLIDLTGSDDGSLDAAAHERPHSQLASGSGSRSASSFLKRTTQQEDTSDSSQRRNGSLGQSKRCTPSKNNESVTQQPSSNGNSQQSPRTNMSQMQSKQIRQSRESGLHSAQSSRTVDKSWQKSEPDVVHLDNDEVPRRKFRIPPGMEPTGSVKSPSTNAANGSAIDRSNTVGQKRAFESDSPLNGFSPSKRPKSAQQDGESRSTDKSQNESHESAKKPREAGNKLAERSMPKSRTAISRYEIDLRSPPKETPQRLAQSPRERLDVSLKQKKKPQTLADVLNGSHAMSDPLTKRTKERLLASDSNDSPEANLTKKDDEIRSSSPNLFKSTTHSDPMVRQEQRALGRLDPASSNAVFSPPVSSITLKKHERLHPPENGEMSSYKSNSPAMNKTYRGSIASSDQSLISRDRRDILETSAKGTNAKTKNHDSHQARGTTEDLSVAINDLVERVVPKGSTSNSRGAEAREGGPEEDLAYESLSSDNENHSKRTSWKDSKPKNRPNGENKPNSRSPSFKLKDALHKEVHDNDETDTRKRKKNRDLLEPSDEDEIQFENDALVPRPMRSRKQAGTSPGAKAVNSLTRVENGKPASEESARVVDIAETTQSRSQVSEKTASRDANAPSQIEPIQDDTVSSVGGKSKRNVQSELKNALTAEPSAIENVTDAEEADFQLRSEAKQGEVENDADGDAQEAFVQPTISASELKDSSMYSNMPLINRVEKVLGKYFEELRSDTEYWTSVSMRRARLTKDDDLYEAFAEPCNPDPDELTSFGHFEPLKMLLHKKGSAMAKSEEEIWSIQRMATDGKPQAYIEMTAPYVTFSTDQQDVPHYAHYVSIKNNILAPNVIHLHCWPYFGDDFDDSKVMNLQDHYKIDILERERKLLLLLKAQKYEEYIESALHEFDCSWSDVLRFLLEVKPNVGLDPGAKKALDSRPLYCQEDFSRNSRRWQAVLDSLPPSNTERLAIAAIFCENFQKMAKFSLWHIAKKSEFTNSPAEAETPLDLQPSDNELTCRICLRFNCPYHGYFKHRADDNGSESDEESFSSVDDVVANDIVHPFKANYRLRVAIPPNLSIASTSVESAPIKRRQSDQNYWSGYQHKAEDRGPFFPCHHPGTSCEDEGCRCFTKAVPCEKSCSCAPDCVRKFKGCSCGSKKGHRLVCFEDADCVCWQLGRECDPDLCGNCGVCDVVDPVNKYTDGVLIGRCRNASIQRGLPKPTLLGDSGVHGLGLYACENIRQNDFVGEYKGEIITKREADRRGAVYEHQKLSYLFSLNNAQEIDSTYFGNKVRFINHAHGEKANLYPRIIMVNTVHRIALYAGRDIHAGKELLFDYGPYFPNEQLQGKKSKKSAPESKKSAPHVRNANLVREFYDVEESEDEDGILRAKAVSHSAAGTKGRAKGKKPRGGARSGAGRKPNGPKPASQQPLRDSQVDVDKEPDAGVRLAAFNISDDVPSEAMDLDAEAGPEDDEEFSPEESESDDSEESDSERSELEDDDEDEELGPPRRYRQRGVVRTRYSRG